jgi:hypothetical protein
MVSGKYRQASRRAALHAVVRALADALQRRVGGALFLADRAHGAGVLVLAVVAGLRPRELDHGAHRCARFHLPRYAPAGGVGRVEVGERALQFAERFLGLANALEDVFRAVLAVALAERAGNRLKQLDRLDWVGVERADLALQRLLPGEAVDGDRLADAREECADVRLRRALGAELAHLEHRAQQLHRDVALVFHAQRRIAQIRHRLRERFAALVQVEDRAC